MVNERRINAQQGRQGERNSGPFLQFSNNISAGNDSTLGTMGKHMQELGKLTEKDDPVNARNLNATIETATKQFTDAFEKLIGRERARALELLAERKKMLQTLTNSPEVKKDFNLLQGYEWRLLAVTHIAKALGLGESES